MFRKWFVYMDDGKYTYRIAVPAKTKADAIKFVEGNGEVVAVKDVTDECPISLDKVVQALRAYPFGEDETDFIMRALERVGIAE